jgi:hypothetical protein
MPLKIRVRHRYRDKQIRREIVEAGLYVLPTVRRAVSVASNNAEHASGNENLVSSSFFYASYFWFRAAHYELITMEFI